MASVLEICQGLPQRQFGAGETVLDDGGTDQVIYVLLSGSVEIVKGDVQINFVSDPGAIFGEVSVLLGLPHMATVRTLTPSVFSVVDDPKAFMSLTIPHSCVRAYAPVQLRRSARRSSPYHRLSWRAPPEAALHRP